MANCCENKSCEVTALRESHSRVLWVVLGINALDMLGDALVYAFSLFVIARSLRWQAAATVAKGAFMLVFGLGVLAEAGYKIFHPIMPAVGTMGTIGALALAANAICFALLYRHRADNLNMSSTWICSRNDVIANVGVLVAAGATYLLASRWPDIIVGCVIAALFLRSAFSVLRDATRALWPTSPASEPATTR
jgi:Co/Zn/Cd efflux system component